MSANEILSRYRIGSVPYLNARPLIEGANGNVLLDVPARLAARFAAGELDAALLPVYEAVARDRATIVDDIAIASRGEVFSVFLAHRGPLEESTSVALDPDSRTSSHLVRILLAEFHELEPEYTVGVQDEDQARVLIGDPAIRFREAHAEGWTFLDLGAEWLRCTGLPFVFACWVFRPELAGAPELAEALREMKRSGLDARGRIAAESPNEDFVRRYLTVFIRFDLGAEERQAVELFAALLRKHGLVESSRPADIRYV